MLGVLLVFIVLPLFILFFMTAYYMIFGKKFTLFKSKRIAVAPPPKRKRPSESEMREMVAMRVSAQMVRNGILPPEVNMWNQIIAENSDESEDV